jgi:hypothetical protein
MTNCKALSPPCSAFLVRLGSSGAGLPFYWIAAATSVAMSFIAPEGKVSFECCRPYKQTRRLSLGRSRQFVWAPRVSDTCCSLIVQKSVPAVRIHLAPPTSRRFKAFSKDNRKNRASTDFGSFYSNVARRPGPDGRARGASVEIRGSMGTSTKRGSPYHRSRSTRWRSEVNSNCRYARRVG